MDICVCVCKNRVRSASSRTSETKIKHFNMLGYQLRPKSEISHKSIVMVLVKIFILTLILVHGVSSEKCHTTFDKCDKLCIQVNMGRFGSMDDCWELIGTCADYCNCMLGTNCPNTGSCVNTELISMD
ncbi:unnamed protein product [Cuscuta epithymum]|uniref:Uncharacterized protein n=1 Tax=Cuscuta epithymum TaxID=186058 RepID=A0AAV0FU83_9ASTE|nr:unnamed protein product [Cuscuta epithymum]